MKRIAMVFAGVFVIAGSASRSWADFGVPTTGASASSAAPASSSLSLRNVPLDVLTGAAIFDKNVGVALAVRGPFVQKVWWELGGMPPFQASGVASDQATSVVSPFMETDSARVRSFGEAHAVLLYPLFESPRISGRPGLTVDAGAGVAVAFVTNEIDKQVTGGASPVFTAERDGSTLVGPRVQLGAALALTDRLSLRLDLTYLNFTNRDSSGVHTFNLSFSGIMITPMLQIKI